MGATTDELRLLVCEYLLLIIVHIVPDNEQGITLTESIYNYINSVEEMNKRE